MYGEKIIYKRFKIYIDRSLAVERTNIRDMFCDLASSPEIGYHGLFSLLNLCLALLFTTWLTNLQLLKNFPS